MSRRAIERSGSATDGGLALFRLVRFWSRRWINRTSENLPAQLRGAQHVQVVEAVAATVEQGGEATIGTVAHQLGLDHSGASRMVRDATAAGLLARTAAAHDRRKTFLALTTDGEQLLADAYTWQRQVFAELTADWDDADRKRFAGYLRRLSEQLPR
ncbi:MarR family transcriptional regulator [Nocardia brasiliensis]|uniref:MarR family transcriptional regulator n=1 Tax=Nocardia brasiliensis TaxID=37326 RepID=A0A6G9XZM9_NOCBR|nr:MarR family winged helix-turn-helix transcriptional regulator [Nocardia brasiliensis]QIS06384.1 MarR family transcriptional regulator [Nocardia brasiliensis]